MSTNHDRLRRRLVLGAAVCVALVAAGVAAVATGGNTNNPLYKSMGMHDGNGAAVRCGGGPPHPC